MDRGIANSLRGLWIGRALWGVSLSLTTLILCTALFVYLHLPLTEVPFQGTNTANDASTLSSTTVSRIVEVKSTQDISQSLVSARTNNYKVSIAGKRQSMGGQTLFENALLLDMTRFNSINSFDRENSIISVQSGATWNDIQNYLNPLGYAVLSMQGPNVFTVGGSISVNAHGWDTTTPCVADTVRWFTLMLADGSIKRCSLTENQELYHLVLGGFGLFGVILDVGLKVTKNTLLRPQYSLFSYKQFPTHFATKTAANSQIELSYADFSIAKSALLNDMVVSDFARLDSSSVLNEQLLVEESYVLRDRFFINLSRRYDWGKSVRWQLYKIFQLPEEEISRNKLMRSPFKRLLYYSPTDVDILQEYFIPREHFIKFTDQLRRIVSKYQTNLLNTTLRIINKSDASFLNYAKQDAFAFVIYLNIGKDKTSREIDAVRTREIIDLTLNLQGTFYLPYLLHYEKSQLQQAYPEIDQFFALKRKYDPTELFMNKFYQKYALQN